MGTGTGDRSKEKPDDRKNQTRYLIDSIVSSELSRRNRTRGRRWRPSLPSYKTAVALTLLSLTIATYTNILPFSRILTGTVGGSDCIPPQGGTGSSAGPARVALIDQLAMQYPNPGFSLTVGRLARTAGYGYDYFSPKAATLGFFLNLAYSNYSILVLRTHGAGVNVGDRAAIATSDPYSKDQRVFDQLMDRLIPIDINGALYFALTPQFITQDLCGRFPGTVVLAMFCAGGGWIDLARAFVDKGAKAFIGWSGRVTVDHTDLAFQMLVDLLLRGYPPASAVQIVMERIGPDPWTGSRLIYHI